MRKRVTVKWFVIRMSTFSDRLREERKRLDLNQTDFAAVGGVKKETQSNYETGTRKPDSAYLEAIAAIGVDVGYLITGVRVLGVRAPAAGDDAPTADGTVMRVVTREESALLDNYEAADEQGRAAARSVLDALAQPKRANG
ncbi:helix-turn-helix domain-containing protein [Variovorax boronicumulans]